MRRELGGLALSMLVVMALGGAAGCHGTIGPADDDDGGPVTIAFTSPTVGASFARDTVEPSLGWRAARVEVALAIGGAPASIELSAGGVALGAAALDAADATRATGQATLIEPGAVTLTATARDAEGAAVATATVDVMVIEPEIASCRGWLDLYGIPYTVGPSNQGVADPVTLTPPINGIPFRYLGNANPRATFFMDCSLARSLLEAAPYLRARGIVEATDIGVYNYRCIGTGTPPNCPNGMSQHAYAKAIDLAGFTDGEGTFYSVNDDWVIDPSSEPTCSAATSNDKDALLHELICELKANGIWNIVLTPNYNADHRNHFHVDLTSGSNFIRKPGADPTEGPDIEPTVEIDSGPDDH